MRVFRYPPMQSCFLLARNIGKVTSQAAVAEPALRDIVADFDEGLAFEQALAISTEAHGDSSKECYAATMSAARRMG